MPLDVYRAVLRRPGVSPLLVLGVLARVPHAATGVVLTLHVVLSLDRGYAAAGLVGTASTVGMALGGPWRGRAVDRWGLRRALVPSIITETAVWSAAPFLGYRQLLVAALVAGALGLPIFTVVRQSLAVLVPEGQRRTAYALDSVGVELSFVAGPAAGVLVATQVSTTVALVGVGACTVLAGLALMAVNPATRSGGERAAPGTASVPVAVPAPREGGDLAAPGGGEARRRATGGGRSGRPRFGPDWFSPTLGGVLATTAAACMVLSATDVTIVAILTEGGASSLTGVVFAVWCLGSIVGGVAYGAARRSVPPVLLLAGLCLLSVPVGLAPNPVVLGLLLVPAGLMCAPVMAATSEAVSRLVPEARRGEALGWHGSALTVGSAIGFPVTGAVIDAAAPGSGLIAVASLGVVLSGAGLLVARRRPPGRSGSAAGAPEAIKDTARAASLGRG